MYVGFEKSEFKLRELEGLLGRTNYMDPKKLVPQVRRSIIPVVIMG
jgi:hypothetical protein